MVGIAKYLCSANPGHSGHVSVGDQAGGLRQKARRQDIGCRLKRLDGVAYYITTFRVDSR
jgi:hypothetical protein